MYINFIPSAYLMRIEIGVEYNHGIGAPEIDTNLMAIAINIRIDEGSSGSHPARSRGQEIYEDV